tara:strand:- start:13280 stop:13756 length:477 start_codon:yes stop_codon:yes gene_type:complete
MKLSEKINNKTIIYPLQSNSKEETIHELLDYFKNQDYLTDTAKLFSYLNSGDETFTTAAGRGVAYHYHTSIEVKDTLAVLGISKKGIDYSAVDGLMCHFILLILEPTISPNSHRRIINLFQELIKDPNIKSKLLELNSSTEAGIVINEWENNNLVDNL